MSIYKPSLLDKFKDFVNGLRSNWDDYETHKAEMATLTKMISVVEDFDSIIPTTFDFGFKPAVIYIVCAIDFKKYISYGFATSPSQNSLVHFRKDMDGYNISDRIFLAESNSNRIIGTITFTSTGITINWTKDGALPDVTAGTKRKVSVIAFKK